MKKFLFALALAVALNSAAQAAELTVSAAASLANAFDEIKAVFENAHPGVTVNCNYAASDPLLRQIEAGAPVDVFASADQATMDKAEKGKLLAPGSRRDFAANDLVVIVPKSGKKPQDLADLVQFGHIAIGNPDSVPAGRYAKAALQKAGLWEKLEPKFIMGSSVRQALDYVSRGEVDAGLVYATDARQQGDKVDVALVVEGHEPVIYPLAITVGGKNPEMGREFIDFVLSPEGQAILARYGFARP